MRYVRMPIEIESPEQLGYGTIDCNLTESSFADVRLGNLDLRLDELLLCYGDHAGKPSLRARLTEGADGLTADHVLVTPGAAAALFIVATSLLEAGDELVVARPNYATNIETPRAIGASIKFIEQRFENGYRVDLAELERLITPRTKYVSLTCPHNPTGSTMTEDELRAVVALVERKGCYLLLDETYREMTFGPTLPLGASLSPRVIGVSSLSKTYGLPGIRLGWLMTRDPALYETFLAAKEQIVITNSVVDEEIADRFLTQRAAHRDANRRRIDEHFAIVKAWIAGETRLEWVEPKGGVVCFPRIRADVQVDVDAFYRVLNGTYKTHVGPGHWFEQDRRSMRIGYGWPTTDELRRGLANVSRALDETCRVAS